MKDYQKEDQTCALSIEQNIAPKIAKIVKNLRTNGHYIANLDPIELKLNQKKFKHMKEHIENLISDLNETEMNTKIEFLNDWKGFQ